jgi:hypothetical protein
MGNFTTHLAGGAYRHLNSAMEELLESFIFHCKDGPDGRITRFPLENTWKNSSTVSGCQ